MSLQSPKFFPTDLRASEQLVNKLARFWISQMPADLSPIQIGMILSPIQRETLLPLLFECWKKNPAVFDDAQGMSFRPEFLGDIAQAKKFAFKLQPEKRPDGSVGITFLYASYPG